MLTVFTNSTNRGHFLQLIIVLFKLYNRFYYFNLAEIVGDPACAKDPDLTRDVNLKGAFNTYEASEKAKVKKFVFASTCSNYGKMDDPKAYVDENSKLAPVSLYAELKVKFENYMLNEIDPFKHRVKQRDREERDSE